MVVHSYGRNTVSLDETFFGAAIQTFSHKLQPIHGIFYQLASLAFITQRRILQLDMRKWALPLTELHLY